MVQSKAFQMLAVLCKNKNRLDVHVTGTFHVNHKKKSCYDFTTFLSFPRTRKGKALPLQAWGGPEDYRKLNIYTAIQAGRARVPFPMVLLEFFIDRILPAALWSRD
jgi:hypothetical protein